jgi:manganese/zinc/iron transport system permease protein
VRHDGAEFVPLSLPPMLIGTLAAIACALPGNFLLLRRQALIGDAISHVVLPGIVVAFLVTGTVAAGRCCWARRARRWSRWC